ncbi:MAG: hypothetical protein EP330_07095 [Deltaproteobacteria bacterium]|nr:MAG: hypothetical protein EP330_07095 [Deltaproteobacteria bacterium]
MSRLAPVFALFLAACGGGDLSWSFADVLAVDAGLSNGSVTVHPGISDEVRVSWSGGGVGPRAIRPDVDLVDGVLTVDAMGGMMSGGEVIVEIPHAMPIRGRVERGDLCIEVDEPAHIDACVVAGGLYMAVPEGDYRLALDVGAGDMTVEGVSHRDDASHVIRGCVAAGDLSLYGEPSSDGGSW